VPLGCFLSGGIDSGLVTAIAASHSSTPIRTFAVGFAGASPDEDERPLARLVAERYGCRHEEITVDPDHRALLPRALWHVGEPFADISILPTYQISREARRRIKVALSGDGGDESFAGYANVASAVQAERLRRLPRPLLNALARISEGWPLDSGASPLQRISRFFSTYVLAEPAVQVQPTNFWTPARRRALCEPSWWEPVAERGAADVIRALQSRADPGLSDPEMHLFTDLHLRLPGQYLPKVDIASNMASLEVRSPFLDHELVELAGSLPFSHKLLEGRQKGLLRRLATRYLPEELVEARKRGFAPPYGRWLRREWAPLVRDLVGDSGLVAAGLLRLRPLQEVAEAHIAGTADHTQRLWSVLSLEIWWRLFVDRTLAPGDEL